jgi:uridine kinase
MDEKTLERVKQKIETKEKPENFPIKIVAIDGHGGAGKSVFAAKLAKTLNAEILQTDNFASWDNPINWWPNLIKEVFEPIKAGAKILNYRRSKWTANHNPEPVSNQPVTPIMILEGVSSARREFRPYITYAIWVETPRELCLKRGIDRDGEKMRKQWEEWLAEEDAYIARDNPREYVDIEISGAGNS